MSVKTLARRATEGRVPVLKRGISEKFTGKSPDFMTTDADAITITRRIEQQFPGQTVVLNAKTLEIIARSKNPSEIAASLKGLDKSIITLFIGGPNVDKEIAFHHFCSSPKIA